MLVWLASISPETLCVLGKYGERLEQATCKVAGPQGMKLTIFRSLMR